MNAKWFLGSLLSISALTAPAFSQVSIFIGTPPPPVRYEAAPPMPYPGYVWTQGYWAPVDGRYVWYPGRWARPPYYGAAWYGPRWEHGDRGWRYHEGGWRGRRWHDDDDHHGHHGHGHAYGHDR